MTQIQWLPFKESVLQDIPGDESFFIKGKDFEPTFVIYEWIQGRTPHAFHVAESRQDFLRFSDADLSEITHYARITF